MSVCFGMNSSLLLTTVRERVEQYVPNKNESGIRPYKIERLRRYMTLVWFFFASILQSKGDGKRTFWITRTCIGKLPLHLIG